MRAKILTIQFRKSALTIEHEQMCVVREIGDSADVDFIDATSDVVDWNYPETIMDNYDGLILGGSGDFDFDGNRSDDDEDKRISYELLGKLRPLFEYVFEKDVPTLGICYGHQILGAFAGAQVHYDEGQAKSRSHEVKLLVDKGDHFLFVDLPDTFSAHYGHKDALDRVPEGAVLLMEGGEKCKVSALQYKTNIYTVQFHPELRFEDMVDRIKNSPGYLPEGTLAEDLFKTDASSNLILRNFGKMVATHAQQNQVFKESEVAL